MRGTNEILVGGIIGCDPPNVLLDVILPDITVVYDHAPAPIIAGISIEPPLRTALNDVWLFEATGI